MTDWTDIERQLQARLQIRTRPIAVTFREAAPVGVRAFEGSQPSSCSFWRLAAEGLAFYTVPGDHYNCPIGSYTHNVPLPPDRAQELEQVLGLMAEIGYLKMEEVPGIARMPETPGVIIYAPLGGAPVDPDVVLVAARPGRLMLLQEAALRAGVDVQAPLMGRPTCMAIPTALSRGVVSSTGCIGNRTYTDLPEDEMYVTIPGRDVVRVTEALATIGQANDTLTAYHQDRRQTLATQ